MLAHNPWNYICWIGIATLIKWGSIGPAQPYKLADVQIIMPISDIVTVDWYHVLWSCASCLALNRYIYKSILIHDSIACTDVLRWMFMSKNLLAKIHCKQFHKLCRTSTNPRTTKKNHASSKVCRTMIKATVKDINRILTNRLLRDTMQAWVATRVPPLRW